MTAGRAIALLSAAALSLPSAAAAQSPPTPPGDSAPATAAPSANTSAAQSKSDNSSDTVEGMRTLLDDRIDGGSPAFALLGVAPSDVVRPETPKEVVLGILDGLDERGNFKSGVALDFPLAKLLYPHGVELDYYSNAFYSVPALLQRIEISPAVAVGSGDDKSARASVGIVFTPFTTLDPKGPGRRNECLNRAGEAPAFNPNATDDSKAAEAAWKAMVHACRARFSLRPDKGYALRFGFAPLFVSKTGNTNEFRSQGYAASANATIGLTDTFFPDQARKDVSATGDASRDMYRAMLTLTATFRKKELIPDPAVKDSFLQRDRWSFGGRFEIGRADAVNFGLESVYQHARYLVSGSDSFVTLVASLDLRVSDKQWLGLSLGTSTGHARSGEKLFIGTRFRWALSNKSGSHLAQ